MGPGRPEWDPACTDKRSGYAGPPPSAARGGFAAPKTVVKGFADWAKKTVVKGFADGAAKTVGKDFADGAAFTCRQRFVPPLGAGGLGARGLDGPGALSQPEIRCPPTIQKRCACGLPRIATSPRFHLSLSPGHPHSTLLFNSLFIRSAIDLWQYISSTHPCSGCHNEID